jgi:monoamine oxidase
MHPLDAPVIVGWMAGRDAEEHALDEPDALAQRGIATLARLLDCDREQLTGELECWHTHNWCADPFARGAYSYVRVNGLDAQRRFGEPVEGTLFFAGEAVNADGHVGTVHGAMASGERAARLAL